MIKRVLGRLSQGSTSAGTWRLVLSHDLDDGTGKRLRIPGEGII
jgi:hypothetical protein